MTGSLPSEICPPDYSVDCPLSGLQCGLSSFRITVWTVLCLDYSVHGIIRCHAGLLQLCNGARHHVEVRVITSGPYGYYTFFNSMRFRLHNDSPEFVYTLADLLRQLLQHFRAQSLENLADFSSYSLHFSTFPLYYKGSISPVKVVSSAVSPVSSVSNIFLSFSCHSLLSFLSLSSSQHISLFSLPSSRFLFSLYFFSFFVIIFISFKKFFLLCPLYF